MKVKAGQRPFEEMTRGPFAALLSVPEDGFHWETKLRPVSRPVHLRKSQMVPAWLVLPGTIGDPIEFRRYAPLRDPELHRIFAATSLSEDGVLEFANQYGILGPKPVPLRRPERAAGSVQGGEPLRFWLDEIGRCGRLVALWDLIQRQKTDELAAHVRWTAEPLLVEIFVVSAGLELHRGMSRRTLEPRNITGKTAQRLAEEGGREVTISYDRLADLDSENGRDLLGHWSFGDPVEPAMYYVFREVNNSMAGMVHPAVLPFRRGDIHFFPDSLLGAIYATFALELAGKSYASIACRGCGRYFTPRHGRQVFCEAACRKRHNRREPYIAVHGACGAIGSTTGNPCRRLPIPGTKRCHLHSPF